MKVDYHFLSNRMEYDRSDSFPFDFESNENSSGSNRKEICHQDHIRFNLKGNENLFFWVYEVAITGI